MRAIGSAGWGQRFYLDPNTPAWDHRCKRVVEKIQNDLLHLRRIGEHPRKLVFRRQRDLNSFLACSEINQLNDLAHDEGNRRAVAAAAADARDASELRDDVGDAIRLLDEDIGVAACFAVLRSLP